MHTCFSTFLRKASGIAGFEPKAVALSVSVSLVCISKQALAIVIAYVS